MLPTQLDSDNDCDSCQDDIEVDYFNTFFVQIVGGIFNEIYTSLGILRISRFLETN